MDYCSSCRRHLNGALVCPGCGAYAPDIAPFALGGSTGSAAPGPQATPAADTWYDGYFRDETAPSPAAEEIPSQDVEAVSTDAPMGRAARRKQRARWKKNQRKAVVATAVALVGGGLTFSALNQQSGDKAQAATAPQQPNAALPEQTTQYSLPVSTPPSTHKDARPSTPSSDPTPTNAARESVTTPHTTRQFTRPDAASTPTPTPTKAPQTQTVSPNPGGANSNSGNSTGGDTAEQQTPAPAPTDDADSGSGASPAPTSPAPEATDPAQLCVLNLLCLG